MCLTIPGCKAQPDNTPTARRMLKRRASIGLMALPLAASLLIALRPAAHADRFDDKSDRFLKHKRGSSNAPVWTSVIVQLDGPLNDAREQALENVGATIHHRFPRFNAIAVRIRPSAIVVFASSSRSTRAQPAAAPSMPVEPVMCQPRS